MTDSKEGNRLRLCDFSAQGYTGIAYYDHAFCQALHDKGVDVTLVTSKHWLVDETMAGYAVKKFFINTYGPRHRLVKGVQYLLGSLRALFFVLGRKVNVIHFQLLELPAVDLVFFALFRFLGVKIVFTPHDLVSYKFGDNRKVMAALFRKSDRIVVHNQANENALLDRFPGVKPKIRYITQGNYSAFIHDGMTRESARRQLDLPAEGKIVLVFGNIRDGKGTETALRGFQKLDDKHGVTLVVAGSPNRGFDMGPIRALAGAPGMTGHVVLRDYFIPDEDVEAYYKAADIVLVPYERIYTSAVLVYAYSCARACIVSDRPELMEFASGGEDCLTFRTGDAGDLSEKIKALLQDDRLRISLAERAGKKAAEKWSWNNTADQLMEIYHEIL